ncbi:hypothetical protein PPUN15366_00930 [Pseudomonas putida]|uniref:hypothetical protein n=1 Tax=Pseudomonas putida TaxID=303 RepID=UPI00235C1961|nr:hypothetical protein [Pseudomonas putida]GLO38449.1 hypothetical protein PPUN15366_00930 [Pseudomonas putida]HDS0973486.1 hypothetical protein [Pseudomonas putida]
MTNVNVYLRENLANVTSKISIAPNIDEKKLNNAVKAFGFSGSPSNVVALLDNTLMGSGKDGILFTGEQIIYRASFSDPISVPYASIASAAYVETLTGSKKDKIEASVLISRRDASDLSITALINCDYRKLAETLQGCIDGFEEFKEERQLVPISELSEPLKMAYVQAVINMAYDNDDVVDDKEFAEILQLMTRLDLSPDTRFTLRAYMASSSAQIPLATLVEQINTQSPAGQIKALHISLVKDLINLFYSTGGRDVASFAFLQKNCALLQVSDEEIELAISAIKNDHDMLRDDMTDDQIVSALKLLSAKAAAVGTPLAAVYLSGSVVGMSAAGLTSGLASLGMGGLLGMSGMMTGIGVAVLIGVGAYAGVRKLTGANEINRSKRRELMLNEVIKQTQLTISLVMKDINFITGKLNEYIQAHGAQDEKIKKLMGLMVQMTSAGTVLTDKSSSAQASANKLRCAQYLDEGKLKALTREPTKAELYHFIFSFYEEREIVAASKDEDKQIATKLVIKSGRSSQELESLARAFEAIGYFNVSDVLKGTAADVAGKARDKLSGLFS